MFICSIISIYIYKQKQIYVEIENHKVNQIEFDFYYNYIKDSFLTKNESNLDELGINPDKKLENQSYNQSISWETYFEQQTIEMLKQEIAFLTLADKENYKHDVTNDYKEFENSIRELAKTENKNINEIYKKQFGEKATEKNVKPFIENQYRVLNFYKNKIKEFTPNNELLDDYYQENPDKYDSVDYRFFSIPVNYNENATEDEIEQAMDATKHKANEFQQKITDEISFTELCMNYSLEKDKDYYKDATRTTATNITYNQLSDEYSYALFTNALKNGESTVIYDEENNSYVVLYLLNRYLDNEKTVNFRNIYLTFTSETKSEIKKEIDSIYNEWNQSEKTENNFIELVNKYSEDTTSNNDGGLYENTTKNSIYSYLQEWLYNNRNETDVTILEGNNEYQIIYFKSYGNIGWKEQAIIDYQNEKMEMYLNKVLDNMTVKDTNNHFEFIKKTETSIKKTLTDKELSDFLNNIEENNN